MPRCPCGFQAVAPLKIIANVEAGNYRHFANHRPYSEESSTISTLDAICVCHQAEEELGLIPNATELQ